MSNTNQDTAPKRTFEECSPEIKKIINNKRYEWTFKADLMMDFDDVASIILTHVWKKWHLYDQRRPLGGWVATVTNHQFANILRDRYQSTSSPCSRCPCNMGGNACSLYGVQGQECGLFAQWYKTKRYAHDVRLPVPIENHLNEVREKPDNFFDVERATESLHSRIKKRLTNSEWDIYERLYIQNKDEEETAKELGFKTSEVGRKMGYKRIRQVKTIILQKAKQILNEEGVESFDNE